MGVGGSKPDSAGSVVGKMFVEVVGQGWPIWVGQSCGEEVDEPPFSGRLGPFDGPSGPFTEVGGGELLDEEGVWVGKPCSEELVDSPLKGGSGPLGPHGDSIEVVATAVLDDRVIWIVVPVLTGGDDPVKNTPFGPPPGPLFPPKSSVVTTVIVWEHESLIGTKG